ncbi:hypothetical protein PR202_gb20976 [Eleusine coracana subsp. coracana]|uniref:Uncharacterized protein n=1 Tax=Eleusine coracana subsp. coracana TaxID=191504 RepID=A0AAV5FBV3_ELECO|nr:hypothetical protein PR202_gb20976 [Eleusine coracana subsp. coracana]
MLLLKSATPFAYAKVDKVDAEELRRLKAQYLIHKVLEESMPAARSRLSRPAALTRVKARIGVRLKKLRLAVRGVRVRACRTVQRHLRSLRRLLMQGSGEPAASPS